MSASTTHRTILMFAPTNSTMKLSWIRSANCEKKIVGFHKDSTLEARRRWLNVSRSPQRPSGRERDSAGDWLLVTSQGWKRSLGIGRAALGVSARLGWQRTIDDCCASLRLQSSLRRSAVSRFPFLLLLHLPSSPSPSFTFFYGCRRRGGGRNKEKPKLQ